MTNSGNSPRIWALLGARAGDNDQVLGLAEAIGLPFEIKQLHYNRLRVLGPRLLGRSLASLTKDSRAAVRDEQPPDLTISTGHRSVAVAQWLRCRSHGRMRAIHVGFPRLSPANFDLVIATPQYPVPAHPNLLRVPFALTRAANTRADPADETRLARLPVPRRLLLIGGPTMFWRISQAEVFRTLSTMIGEARDKGGSVLVSTSPRTPAKLRDAVANLLTGSDVPHLLTSPGETPRYPAMLALADSIQVTADSVAMVSDAIWTGKAIGLVPIAPSRVGRVVMSVMDRLLPGRSLYPRDLRRFWTALAAIGVTEKLATPRSSAAEQLRKVLASVRPILKSLNQ